MTVIVSRSFHTYYSKDYTKRDFASQKNIFFEHEMVCPTKQNCTKAYRGSVGNYFRARHCVSSKNGKHDEEFCNGLMGHAKNSAFFSHFGDGVVRSGITNDCDKESVEQICTELNTLSDLSIGKVFPRKFRSTMTIPGDLTTCAIFNSKCGAGVIFSTDYYQGILFRTDFCTGMIFRTQFGTGIMFRAKFGTYLILHTRFGICIIYQTEFDNAIGFYTEVCTTDVCATEFFTTNVCTTEVCTTGVCSSGVCTVKVCTMKDYTKDICASEVCPSDLCNWVMFPGELGAGNYRTVGRRKNGEQKNGKQKKSENGSKYGGKNGSGRSRRGSQGNGSSGIEGSGDASGNGDESSDDENGDGDDEDLEEEDDDEEDDDDEDEDEEMEEDTDNVSAMAEDEAEDTTNGGGESMTEQQSSRLELGSHGAKVTSTTLEIHTTGGGINDDVGNDEDSNAMTSVIAPAEPGTPVTLSGVIWKETMGGVLVVNLKWRNKTYSGSLIDHSRYGWANPRNLEDPQECDISTSSRGSKGKKGKHKEAAYTGNPLSPKMSGNGKRGAKFHRNKGKHNKESSSKSKTKRGSDTAEEGTRTRRRSCTVKTSVSPSPSPTPLIECPERNCNKKYKHINGLRYHQAHAHLDNTGDGEDKDSYDEDDMKSNDLKEPLSANSKSSGSDDVKPLSHRKAKNQKANSKTSEVSELSLPEDSLQNDEKLADSEETGDKYEAMDIKVEDPEPIKNEERKPTSAKPNILEEAVKIIFDEPAGTQDLMVPTGIFSRMTSQAMLAASHPPEYKYVGYEPMEEGVSEYEEKTGTSGETQELDVTVKEEVIDEGHAGVAKTTCKEEAEETFKLENTEIRFNGTKSGDVGSEETPKSSEDEKTKWSPEKAGKSRKTDVANVAKEQIKTSAAEIRSLPGYKHFRLPPSNSAGFLTQGSHEKYAKSLTLDTGLLDSKDPQKGGIPKETPGTPRQERAGEKADSKSMVWKVHGAPSASSASFQLTCESKARPGYMPSSRKPFVVTASTTWVPEVHPAVTNKLPGGSIPGQEVIPEKPGPPRETAEKSSPRPRETAEEQDDERTKAELGKGDDERSKGAYSGKPARAVGVAHPFNAEKSEGEFALGMVGNITTDPVRVLYSKSSSPKMAVDRTHPEMTEVKKVRVEKTLEVPIGEVVPLAKTSRSAVTTGTPRGSVMVGSDTRGNFNEMRGCVPDDRVPQIVAPSPPMRDPQQAYAPSLVERSSPWRPAASHSPSREHEPRSLSDSGQSTSQHRNPMRRSPVPDHRSTSFRSITSGYVPSSTGRRSPEKDTRDRFSDQALDKRLPFRDIDERLAQKGSNKGPSIMEIARNSPGKDIPGGLHPRSESPRKDTPGSFHERMVAERAGYREPERGSPFSETVSRRQYDKSPIPDRRSPAHTRRSHEREIVERPSFRDSSPNPLRDTARHSPYRERVVKLPGESEGTSQRKDSRSPVGESRTVENLRGYRMKPEVSTTKEAGDSPGSQRVVRENKLPRMSEEDAMVLQARNAVLYQHQAAACQDSAAAREAVDNYMMYISRMSMPPGFDPRLMQAYPMLAAGQMPLVFQSAKENTTAKEERSKEVAEDIRRKTNTTKPEPPRSRGESSDVEMMASKRHFERMGSSRSSEKTEFESSQVKRSKASDVKEVHEIMDEKEGGRMQLKTLEQRALQQQWQHRMDAFNQLQTEKNLKLKAEERSVRPKPPSSSSTSRLKSTIQESRTVTKREEKGFSKEEKARVSPVNIPSSTINTSESTMTARSRNPESKSPLPTSSGAYFGFVPTPNLPANHALSTSYEHAMAMQGYSPFLMHSPFHFPPGMMIANPLVPGSQLHNAVSARGLDPKRDPTRSYSSSSDRARSRDDDSQETESRNESRDFSSQTKKDMGSTPRINPPTPPPTRGELDKDRPKERQRGEYEEGKQRTIKDTTSLHGTQTLPSNLAYRRADMSGGVIDPGQFVQAFPGMMYPAPQGSFRPPYDHPFISHQRK